MSISFFSLLPRNGIFVLFLPRLLFFPQRMVCLPEWLPLVAWHFFFKQHINLCFLFFSFCTYVPTSSTTGLVSSIDFTSILDESFFSGGDNEEDDFFSPGSPEETATADGFCTLGEEDESLLTASTFAGGVGIAIPALIIYIHMLTRNGKRKKKKTYFTNAWRNTFTSVSKFNIFSLNNFSSSSKRSEDDSIWERFDPAWYTSRHGVVKLYVNLFTYYFLLCKYYHRFPPLPRLVLLPWLLCACLGFAPTIVDRN